MNIASILGLIVAIFGVLGIVGGAVAYLLSIRLRTTITVLKENNEALVARVSILEVTERECQVRLTKAETTVQVLTDTVTQAQAVADLQSKVDRVIAVASALDIKVDQHFAEILGRLARS